MNKSFHDSLKFEESLSINSEGRMVARHPSGHMLGVLEMNELDKYGNVIFTDKRQNDITIAGSTFVLEQLFKTKSTNYRFNIKDLGSKYSSEVTDDSELKDEFIFGFMVGVGGEDATGTIMPSYKTTRLSSNDGSASFVPFRIEGYGKQDTLKTTASNNSTDYTGMYTVKGSTIGNSVGYFVKTFDDKPEIKPEYADGSGVKVTDVFSDSDSPIYTYCQVNMTINGDDVRDYFLQRYGTIENCRINQLGLVGGKVNKSSGNIDVSDLKLVTTVNFKGRDLSNAENTFKFRYKIYCL